MRWMLILFLTLAFTVLGCTPTDQPVSSEDVLNNPDKYASQEVGTEVKPGEWLTDWDQAIAVAKKQKLPILVDFTGSDWCIWCKKLDSEVFSKEEFINYAKKNLVLLKLDFPHGIPQSDAMKAANKKKMNEFNIEGFPTIVLVNAEGKEIARTGYRPGGAESYINHLQDLLTKQNDIK
ncbi:MAG TPA: thioredoxin family protein [Candidatus Cloacimonas sp.]|jgi:protein disulfide-isomerase|nr:thioredoxin family protein [Candidatus Cloacimonas sp.]